MMKANRCYLPYGKQCQIDTPKSLSDLPERRADRDIVFALASYDGSIACISSEEDFVAVFGLGYHPASPEGLEVVESTSARVVLGWGACEIQGWGVVYI